MFKKEFSIKSTVKALLGLLILLFAVSCSVEAPLTEEVQSQATSEQVEVSKGTASYRSDFTYKFTFPYGGAKWIASDGAEWGNFYKVNGSYIYVATGSKVYRTNNNGSSWEQVLSVKYYSYIEGIAYDHIEDRLLVLIDRENQLWSLPGGNGSAITLKKYNQDIDVKGMTYMNDAIYMIDSEFDAYRSFEYSSGFSDLQLLNFGGPFHALAPGGEAFYSLSRPNLSGVVSFMKTYYSSYYEFYTGNYVTSPQFVFHQYPEIDKTFYYKKNNVWTKIDPVSLSLQILGKYDKYSDLIGNYLALQEDGAVVSMPAELFFDTVHTF